MQRGKFRGPADMKIVLPKSELGNGRLVPTPGHYFRTFQEGLQSWGNVTICKAFTRDRSTDKPQCKCGPVTRPVAPTLPRTAPTAILSPTFASISDRWQYSG